MEEQNIDAFLFVPMGGFSKTDFTHNNNQVIFIDKSIPASNNTDLLNEFLLEEYTNFYIYQDLYFVGNMFKGDYFKIIIKDNLIRNKNGK